MNNICLEVLFHVLPDYCFRHDTMVGRTILSQSITVYMTANEIILSKVNVVDVCNKTKTDAIDSKYRY